MRARLRILTVAGLLAPGSAAGQAAPIDTLRWLAGCWRLTTPTTTIDEQWMMPAGGEMLGMSRTVANGRPREHEFLRIYQAGDTLVYAARPSGQQPTEFRAAVVRPNEVEFANPAHDFPQRIRYRLAARDLLVAAIEGDRAGKRPPVVFSYAKAECVPGTPAPSRASAPAATAASARAELQPKYDSLLARETGHLGAVNAWYAESADPEFVHVMWTAGGQSVPLATREVLAAAGERMRLGDAGAGLENRRYTHLIEKVATRGDTAEVLVASRYVWTFADTAGRYGERGAELERSGTERRLDRWVRSAGGWRLRRVDIIGVEVSVGGRVVSRDGRPVPAAPRTP